MQLQFTPPRVEQFALQKFIMEIVYATPMTAQYESSDSRSYLVSPDDISTGQRGRPSSLSAR